MPDHILNRDIVITALRQELVGPCPLGQEIDSVGAVQLDDPEQAYRRYRQIGTGEEILQRDAPTKRYGIGVLYPMATPGAVDELGNAVPVVDADFDGEGKGAEVADPLKPTAVKDCDEIASRAERRLPEADSDDFDLSSANEYKPSSMAVSLLVRLSDESKVVVKASGGRYTAKEVTIVGRQREWWLRSPVQITATYCKSSFPNETPRFVVASEYEQQNGVNLDVRVEVYARPQEASDEFLITVCLINRQTANSRVDAQCLFQSRIEIHVEDGADDCRILPYPTSMPLDDEEWSQRLLYRDKLTFAVGHGCAADWKRDELKNCAEVVTAECLPLFEAPSITPDIYDISGRPLTGSMKQLAGLDIDNDGLDSLTAIVEAYERWIADQHQRVRSLPLELQATAVRHLAHCSDAVRRMREGLESIRVDPQIRRAFQLANLAMVTQQLRSRRESRTAAYDSDSATIYFEEPIQSLDFNASKADMCRWRAFQIAFILAALRSTAFADDRDRELVELIWFPTGGGKTEAYLGLAAFSIFLRRLRAPSDSGVQALMRYTLRLLTAQQFQRASRLICSMEYVRRQFPIELGESSITIGIWLGGSTTPNSCSEALAVFRSLSRGDGDKPNQFLLDRCPWCGAQMGPVTLNGPGRGKGRGRSRTGVPKVIGYEQRGGTVVYACADRRCEFHQLLPLYVIDEDIYQLRPDFLIGTVDKFAMLAWKPEARSLFGLNIDGIRQFSPPSVIIQDELHLISGPLGSMVGLYETVIEELCTDRRDATVVRPKIISSTATIRSYTEQVRGVFGRINTCLFPPPGLDADDSFFARLARQADGSVARGRIYIGVHAPSLGSLQTVQVRTFAALLQASQQFNSVERDPWWTLLLFFNSLRELGTTLTLFQSDIPDLLRGALRQRFGHAFQDVRQLRKMLELTGRLSGDEVPKAITALEVPTESQHGHAVDVCLASNIIEVGVDIDRLSLMAVVGQPKTTSQYIQVTGRVGRKADRPGLVVTIYAASKPRDRSHFEKFRSYHERLYAQVEPTSVTPFSRPALDRAAHAVVASFVRQFGDSDQAESPYPFPALLFAMVKELLEDRASVVDQDELTTLARVLEKRRQEWQMWQRLDWSGRLNADDMPLLRPAGAYVSREKARVSWSTPQSLRNVDAECQAEITQLYLLEEDNNA